MLPNRGLDFCSQFCTAVADRQEQHKSGLLCLQVSQHIGTRDTESFLNLSVLWCQACIYLLTKKSVKVKKLRGHYENGIRAEFGSQGTS